MTDDNKRSIRAQAGEPLLDFWYPAMRCVDLKRGEMRREVLLNTPILVCRDNNGQVFALDDHCPHRGIPLSDGTFDGEQVECCYHGWKFNREGECTYIPSLIEDSRVKVERIRTKHFLCAEADEFIWVFMPGTLGKAGIVPDIPKLTVFSEEYRQSHISKRLACNIDHGIVGLMDPAHGPFVHQSFWWRSRKSIHAKAKKFEPIPYGFRMSAHTPSSNSAAYKLLGVYKEPITTTIDFTLPNVRLEQVRCGRYWFSSRTTVTPINNEECRLDFVAAWNFFRWLPLTPIFKLLGNMFIEQDQKIMEKQAIGLRENPTLMLIDDADTQAKWYYQLKAAFIEAQQNGGEFNHPIKNPVTLRWRS
jgi:phenylpropionate dioxygenase-like ring-hydroxylating dioxygenase large terminal subunit